MNKSKKILTFLVTAVFAVTAMNISAASVPTYGDANGDNAVDIKDLVRIKRNLADTRVTIILDNIDDNENRIVDTTDFSKLKKVLLATDSYQLTQGAQEVTWPNNWNSVSDSK